MNQEATSDTQEKIKMVKEGLEMAEAMAPVVKLILSGVVATYAPMLGEQLDKLRTFGVEQRLKTFQELQAGGMTREEALTLMVKPVPVLNTSLGQVGKAVPKVKVGA